ncbi:hypothetical protein ABZ936_02800, partial [Streptomyces sp. NPDC046685]
MTRVSAPKSRQPNGASSIFQGKDGRWHGYVTVGTKDNGNLDRRHVSRKTRPEVTKLVRELEQQRDKGAVRKVGCSYGCQAAVAVGCSVAAVWAFCLVRALKTS